ncbi:MAG: restriction endonuclease [Candidatus Omnitrophota bacterium]
MAIPKYEDIMLPLLKFIADGKEYTKSEAINAMKNEFSISDSEMLILLPSGRGRLFNNRVAWAKTYMKQAGLLEITQRGIFRITQRGKDILLKGPERIDKEYLEQFEEFQSFLNKSRNRNAMKEDKSNVFVESQTPEEIFEVSYNTLKQELVSDLLDNILKCSPSFFEKLVLDLLVKMGYGGSIKDAGLVTGRPGDEGIDGIIKEDKLGLDVIYLQAKRWQNVIGSPEIQKFVGALQGKRAHKGIFITTSKFTQEAINFAQKIDSKVILIDGNSLADLMIDHNVGVTVVDSYEIKRIDIGYFTEE